MASVNKAIVLGNLGRDPETRYLPNGDAVCDITVATTETWKDKGGEKQEKTEWHRVTLFRRLAEIAAEYCKKGSQVYIEGRLETQEYEKDGVKRYSTRIVANELKLLGSPRSSRSDADTTDGVGGEQEKTTRPAAKRKADDFDGDIPF